MSQGYYTNLDKLESNEGVPESAKSTMDLLEASNKKAAPQPLSNGALVHVVPITDDEEARI